MKRGGGGGSDKEEDDFESSDLVLCRECIRKAPQHFLHQCTHTYTICGWQCFVFFSPDLYGLTALSNSIYNVCAHMRAAFKSLPVVLPTASQNQVIKQEQVLNYITSLEVDCLNARILECLNAAFIWFQASQIYFSHLIAFSSKRQHRCYQPLSKQIITWMQPDTSLSNWKGYLTLKTRKDLLPLYTVCLLKRINGIIPPSANDRCSQNFICICAGRRAPSSLFVPTLYFLWRLEVSHRRVCIHVVKNVTSGY